MSRTADQISRHYTVEKTLADRLRNATEKERLSLYSAVYDELYKSVPDHPMLLNSEQQTQIRKTAVIRKLRMLEPYIDAEGTYLEIGAGDCAMSIAMSECMRRIIALEVSESITSNIDLPDNVEVAIIEEPAAIPVENESVKLAFSDQLAEHLHPDDFLNQCKNVFKALASGGKYVVVTPNRINGPHDISRGFDDQATGMHLKEYTYTELSALLCNVGFKQVKPIVGFRGYYMALPSVSIKLLESGLQRLPKGVASKISNTLPIQMLLAIRLVATR